MYPREYFSSHGGEASEPGTCFVVMPFAPEFDEVNAAIKQTLEGPAFNFTCKRADDLRGAHIIKDILRGIAQSEIVVVDVTGRNPNVFYELGVAHMAKELDNVVLISRDTEDIPFDLRQFRHVTYKGGMAELRRELEKAVAEISDRVHLIHVKKDCIGRLEYRLMGPGDYHYEFETTGGGLGYGSAKFSIQVTRHGAGIPPKVVEHVGLGLKEGQVKPIGSSGFTVKLRKISDTEAVFRIDALAPAAKREEAAKLAATIRAVLKLDNGIPRKVRGEYVFALSIADFPEGTRAVTYKFHDPTFDEQRFTVENRARSFSSKRQAYGDFPITAELESDDGVTRLKTTLYKALMKEHGRDDRPGVVKALKKIKEG